MANLNMLKQQLEENRNLILKREDARSNLFRLYLQIGQDTEIVDHLSEAYENKDKPLPTIYDPRKNLEKPTYNDYIEMIYQGLNYDIYFELEIFRVKNFNNVKTCFEAVMKYVLQKLNKDKTPLYLAHIKILTGNRIAELEYQKLSYNEHIRSEGLPYDEEKKFIIDNISILNEEISKLELLSQKFHEIIREHHGDLTKKQTLTSLNTHETALLYYIFRKHGFITSNKKFLTNKQLSIKIAEITNDGRNWDEISRLIGKLERDDHGNNWYNFADFFNDWDKINFDHILRSLENIRVEIEQLNIKNID